MAGARGFGWTIVFVGFVCAAMPAAARGGEGPGNAVTSPGAAASGAQKAVEQATRQLIDAQLKGDAAALDRLLADDYVAIGPTGEVSRKKETLERVRKGELKYDAIDLKDLKIRPYGDAAVTTATVDVKGKWAGADLDGTYRVTRVWAKRDGRWRSVSFQVTRVTEPAKSADATPAR